MNISLRSFGIILSIIAVAFSHPCEAQQKSSPNVISLKNEQIITPPNAQQWFDSMAIQKVNEPTQALLQFRQLPDAVQKKQLDIFGIHLMDYIPNLAYTALINFPVNNINTSALDLRSVIMIKKEWKTDSRILTQLNLQSSNKTKFLLSFAKTIPFNEIESIIKMHGGTITDKRFSLFNTYEATLPQNKITELAANAFVKYVNLSAEIKPLNFDARSSSGVNLLSTPVAAGGYDLDGNGVTLGIGDISSGIYHVDTKDRVTNFHPLVPHFHGTHTNGTLAGKGIMDPRGMGMATAAHILGHVFDLVWVQTPYMYKDYNMTITNNSYASVVGDCSYAGTYDQYSQMLDELQKNYPFVQHVFASGNDGPLQCGAYPLAYHTVNGGYQPSKNILTVGAMAKNNIIWPKSSRGPVNDGRLKPEIMAYGFGIYSSDNFDSYAGSNGTSMSSPVVAGNLALIEQRYKQLHSNQNIPSDLLKALAMNGATDMGNPGPDFAHGYGLLNTYRSILMLENNHYLIDSIASAATKQYTISIPANTAALKVMLYWHDDPASPLSATTLINNLDLEVKDPSNNITLPFVLDPSAANVTNNAVQGVDNRNNSEQVVINNPQAGTYTINVKGTLIPSGAQPFVLVYDFVPIGIKIKYPASGNTVPANDSIYIYWDASDDPNSFTIEYSDNNGSSWNTISNNVPSAQRYFFWYTPNISTAQALLRVKRNSSSQQDVAGTFVMNPAATVQLSANQCPGYMAIEWTSVPGASAYQVLKKIGDDLKPFDTVTATNYVFSGLSFDSFYYAGIRPLINDTPGWRGKSVRRMPNDGSCAGNISNGDLVMDTILTPQSGRLFTSTALTNNETLSVRIRNLDDVPVSNYNVSYNLNGGPWQGQSFTNTIPPNGIVVANIPGLNLAAIGAYILKVAVKNLSIADPVSSNDTIIKFIRQIPNAPIDLNNTFNDDFENAALLTVLKDSMGIFPNDHWDYVNSTDTGRLRNFVSSDVLIAGQRSVSMDLQFNKEENQNDLIGTFNLQGYDTASTEARLEFDYKLHGKPKFLSGNEVWVRGNDTQPWLSIFSFDTAATPGQIINTGSLSITKALTDAGQIFSSSFQVRIGQHDTSVIAMNEYGNGLTIDNFKLYSVKNDVQLLSVVSPQKFNCDLDSVALNVLVYNSDNLPQDTIEMFYRFDNGPIITDTIFYLAPKDTINYIFKTKLNASALGQHTLNVWLRAKGDSYLLNDSILNFRFRNQPNITTYPYLENFETSDGSWFADGFNNSWEYGTPNSTNLTQAASGNKVWTTNLTGSYNDNEQSYLYSPCFDLSGLTNPMLSFSLNTDIENCGGTLCDAAYLEYSTNGINWNKLGANGEGYNWYGNLQVWNDRDTRWRVASIPLPAGASSLKLRFVLKSDAGAAWDGIAIDDIHIFDLKYPIYDGGTVTTSNNVTAGSWSDFVSNDKILAQINSSNDINNTDVRMFVHSTLLHPVLHQYNLPRNYVIHNAQTNNGNATVRLFITDEEVIRLLNDHSCDTCAKAKDAYRLGITKYDDADNSKENGALTDNVDGSYEFIPYHTIQWVPYDKGYYAQTNIGSFSEFWFNTSLPGKMQSSIMLFPNPVTNNELNIIWSATPGTELKLVMYDAIGRKMYEATATSNDFDTKTTFTLPDLESGVYTVRLSINDQVNIYKLLMAK